METRDAYHIPELCELADELKYISGCINEAVKYYNENGKAHPKYNDAERLGMFGTDQLQEANKTAKRIQKRIKEILKSA